MHSTNKQFQKRQNQNIVSFEASDYEVGKILRLDDHNFQTSAYFQIHEANFSFNRYSNGTQKQKKKYSITPAILKYFKKRFFLFSRFNEGIHIDEQSWFSAIPQPVSLHILKRMKECGVKTIFEPFCGVGGIAVHLSGNFEEYTVNDIDIQKVRMLQQNLRVYQKEPQCLRYHVKDFLQVEPFRVQVLLICPPWGMIDTSPYSFQPLDSIMHPRLTDILVQARRFTHNLMLQMPKNTNLLHFAKVLHEIGVDPIFTVEKIMTQGKLSQLFIYLGQQSFTNINKSQLYFQIYSTLALTTQEQKKNYKKVIQIDCPSIMKQVYNKAHPHSKLILFQ